MVAEDFSHPYWGLLGSGSRKDLDLQLDSRKDLVKVLERETEKGLRQAVAP